MSKNSKKKSSLGRSLINDRFGKNHGRRTKDPSILHSSEVPDGYDWGRLNLKSVTEESSFQEFLSTAQQADTEFQAEKLNITFVNPFVGNCLLSKQDKERAKGVQEENRHVLGIPRRPKWDETTTREELEARENEEFLSWRRRLAILQEEKQLILTPYEKNLEFWRQLWRVVEKSDIVVQIVDARNPLLFYCEDLQKYVCEVSPHKQNLILLNKADFLTDTQRQVWAEYFEKNGLRAAFYSATSELEETDEETENTKQLQESLNNLDVEDEESNAKNNKDEDSNAKNNEDEDSNGKNNYEDETGSDEDETGSDKEDIDDDNKKRDLEKQQVTVKSDDDQCKSDSGTLSNIPNKTECDGNEKNSNKLLTRSELVSLFHSFHSGVKVTSGITTVGLVGYPNVGKSSTINSLLLEKKVSVSATPGKTKHFQTLYLDKDLLLCDCPGLVMPSFVYSKADMVINGILPIDQMRDHVPPVSLVASLIPRHTLEDTYGIMIPPPREGEDVSRPPTSEELLNAYGYNRGFMTPKAQPDNPKSARHILKDFVNGKLLYCNAPPGYNQEEFHTFPERRRRVVDQTPAVKRSVMANSSSELDQKFFRSYNSHVHRKGAPDFVSKKTAVDAKKPWKDHSQKRNKREKLRRVYAHLDQV